MESFESSTSYNTPTEETAVLAESETKVESEPISKSIEITAEDAIMQEIEELATPLIEKMKEKIDEGAYDLIISDEGSGRLPTLLFRKIYQTRNPGKEIETLFIYGSRQWHDPAAPFNVELFKKKAEIGFKKALIVTDYVSTGRSLEHFLQNLKDAKINDVSVAALRTSWDEHAPNDSKSGGTIASKFTDFFEGDINRGKVPLVVNNKHITRKMAGTEKTWDHAQRGFSHPEIISDFDAEKVKKTRENIDVMAERILEKVWGKQRLILQKFNYSLFHYPCK